MHNFKSLTNFSGLQIKLASPQTILDWSHGEVTKPETINYRSWRPEKDGLFCEKIFGPVKDYECYCGKYKKIRFKGIICDKCGVEVTTSKVRRERMGHIALAAPVVHLWFLKNSPGPISLILDIPQRELESVVYFSKYLVTDINPDLRKEALANLAENSKLKQEQINTDTEQAVEQKVKQVEADKKELSKKLKNPEQLIIAQKEMDVRLKQDIQKLENKAAAEKSKIENLINYLEDTVKGLEVLSVLNDEEMFYLDEFKADLFFQADMGASALLKVLKRVDMDKSIEALKKQLEKTTSKLKKRKLLSKIRILKGMQQNEILPEWMIITNVPVLPPDLRPMVQLTGGRFATSDLNDLYRRLINRNNRLKKLIKLGAPNIILRNEMRMLQEVADMLIDSSKSAKTRRKTLKRTPRSLSDMLKGKKGRFRRNLLGKRVDYSGRSAIVVGPELKLGQVGLPKEIAMEIYRPFLLRELMTSLLAPNIRSAKAMIDQKTKEVYDMLDKVTKDSYVLLNRAPTLHKLSILAFKPKLVDGLAIRLHPCVCAGFNADFDGDQMGVHLPLSAESLKEARQKMMPSRNLLKPSDGSPSNYPTQEMAVGCYYITSVREQDLDKEKAESMQDLPIFGNKSEAILAYQSEKIELRELIVLYHQGKAIKTTCGRILFNNILPKSFDFLNEPMAGAMSLKNLITRTLETEGRLETVRLIDALKDIGFKSFTLSGVSINLVDCGYLVEKDSIIKSAEAKVQEYEDAFAQGLISNEERKRNQQRIWEEVTEEIAVKTWALLTPDSPIRIIAAAGIKRASKDQIKQLSGMRGLMVDPTGKVVPLPTKSNLREGLSSFEYVTGSRGSRKGLADTALRTADAGYLTRRLVDATHHAIIREEDCHTTRSFLVERKEKGRERYFARRIIGRYLSTDVLNPKDNKVMVHKGTLLDDGLADLIDKSDVQSVEVRSPLTCNTRYGFCAKCYGWDLSTRKLVRLGVPVGVIAAQSIGEPGTQLTLRTKHTGGTLGADVTQGLPRVQELFEIRTPKIPSPIAEIAGKVRVKETTDGFEIKLTGKDQDNKTKLITYLLPPNVNLLVADEDLVAQGTPLTSGNLNVREVAEISGHQVAQKYLIDNIQGVYESQGIAIHDKHFEVLVNEMSNKVKVDDPGDTLFTYGQVLPLSYFQTENDKIKATGGKPAKGKKVLLGLIQSSLTTASWLSAASFQQTTSTLTEASLLGLVDNLIGLKENVIIGRLIPVSRNQKVNA